MGERSEIERYQAFMVGYVNRINQATLNVTIGGIRIGSAKYSRLAQINLHSRIITFSRFAIENVPERGRRYLVLHELAHVKEANHTKRFWELVQRHEPNFRVIGHSLDLAFKRNVRDHQQQVASLRVRNPNTGRLEEPKLLMSGALMNYKMNVPAELQTDFSPPDFSPLNDGWAEDDTQSFNCMEDEFDVWDGSSAGAVHGGSDEEMDTAFGGTSVAQTSV